MTGGDRFQPNGLARPIAVVGLACRYPDANDPAELLDLVSTGRRTFRRIPPCRADVADYCGTDPGAPQAAYSARAALIEGWQFDPASLGVSASVYHSTGPAHWLAIETTGRALAAAGLAGGQGLRRDATGVFVASRLAADGARAGGLRLRWPHSRRVMADAMYAAGVPADQASRALRVAAARYLAPFPQLSTETTARATTGSIATAICDQFSLRGGGREVPGGASSLTAVAAACQALVSGELDVALAGGVDLGLDPVDLIAMAKSGMLAAGEMRIYDANPTGFLPGEGCGMVLLMRTSYARAAGLPIHAEILGWGASEAAASSARLRADQQQVAADAASQLLAMRQAYQMAHVDPVDVQLIEGSGTGLPSADEAELTALAALRAASPQQVAALGSIGANIGDSRAAAGAAGLLKAILSMANDVLPPSTGIVTPHPILRDGHAALRLPSAAHAWPDGPRHAAVAAVGADGRSVHVVLRGQPGRSRQARGRILSAIPRRRQDHAETTARYGGQVSTYSVGADHPATYLLQAPDRAALIAILARVAEVAPWLSDAQLQDLAVQLAAEAAATDHAHVKVAIVAATPEQLASLAAEALTLLPELTGGLLTTRPGVFAADAAAGQVTVLLADDPGEATAGDLGSQPSSTAGDLGSQPSSTDPQRELSRTLAVLRWLDELGVQASAAVGHGAGELAGLVWAGCLTSPQARRLREVRAAALGAPAGANLAQLGSAIEEFGGREFLAPRRRLICASTGHELTGPDEVAELLGTELFGARLAADGLAGAPVSRLGQAVTSGAAGACLLVQTGEDLALSLAAAASGTAPVVEIRGGDDRSVATAAAAIYVAGALTNPEALYRGRPSRPIDIWREQAFITDPGPPQPGHADSSPAGPPGGGDDIRNHDDTASNGFGSGSADVGASPGTAPVTGVAPWSGCFVEQPGEPRQPAAAEDDRPWRVFTGGCESLRAAIDEAFPQHPTAGRTLAVLGGLDDAQTVTAAIEAAQHAISSGQLVAVSAGPGLTGLWASLHAEHPSIGITVLRAPLTAAGLRLTKPVTAATPGQFTELAIANDGSVRQPAMVQVQLQGGEFPLGEPDVVLVSRGAGAAGLALAQVLCCSGAAVAIIGRDHPDHDHEYIAGLERLRRAGSRVGYEVVSTPRHAEMVAAIRRIESRLGPVTAVAHATSAGPSRPVSALMPRHVTRALAGQTKVLDQMIAAVRAVAPANPGDSARLRLIATFGSVIGRYGLAGEGTLALVTGALADHGERLAAAIPGCRALHVDWPGWAGTGLGERPDLAERMQRAGFTAMSVGEGSRMLLKALSSRGPAGRLAMHGRVGVPAPRAITVTADGGHGPAGRFTGRLLAHYPGTEVIAAASLSELTDPYLADYQVAGLPTLPAAMALEAMAQVAAVLAGDPIRTAADVVMAAPIVLAGPAGSATDIRICGLREGETITVVIRCDSTGFKVDHYRATFACQPTASGQGRTGAGRAGRASRGSRPRWRPGRHEPPGSLIDAAELYGSTLFQAGRFRLLTTFSVASSGSATATAQVRGAEDPPWFGADVTPGDGDPQLLLGSPGVIDATLQVIQACAPQRRLVPAGCASVCFGGSQPAGVVTIRATQVDAAVPARWVPRQRPAHDDGPASGPDQAGQADQVDELVESAWDVEAVDANGQQLVSWRRLRMRELGPLPDPEPRTAGGRVSGR